MPGSGQWGGNTLHDLLSLSPNSKGLPTLHERHIRVGHSSRASKGAKFAAATAMGMGLRGDRGRWAVSEAVTWLGFQRTQMQASQVSC